MSIEFYFFIFQNQIWGLKFSIYVSMQCTRTCSQQRARAQMRRGRAERVQHVVAVWLELMRGISAGSPGNCYLNFSPLQQQQKLIGPSFIRDTQLTAVAHNI